MRLLIVAICAALFTLSSSFTFVPPSSFLYRSISIRIGEYGPQTGHGNTGLRAVHSNTGFDAAAAGFDTVIDTVNVDTVPDRSSRRSVLSSILKCTSFMTVTTVMTTVIPNNVALADDGEAAAVGDDLSMPEAPKPLTPEEEKKLVEERLAKKAALQKKTAR